MFRKEREPYYRRPEKPKSSDFGSSIAPQPISSLIDKHGESLIGEVVGTRSGTYYVVRGISYLKGETKMLGFRASQLGDFTKSRPRIVFMSGSASAILTNSIKQYALITDSVEYRKILQEINDEGGNVEIPPEKKTEFDIF